MQKLRIICLLTITVFFSVKNAFAVFTVKPNLLASFKVASVYPDRDARCLQWKNVCITKSYCVQHSHLSKNRTCFRCVKPSHYGVHLFPRMQSRQTCNPETADYLRTMSYRCYKPYETLPCDQTREREECHMECIEHAN